jgi:uncharacterized protein
MFLSFLTGLLAGGAVAGFIGGMMGVGGGSIMVPAMVLVVGLSQYMAQGTSLLALVPTGLVVLPRPHEKGFGPL